METNAITGHILIFQNRRLEMEVSQADSSFFFLLFFYIFLSPGGCGISFDGILYLFNYTILL